MELRSKVLTSPFFLVVSQIKSTKLCNRIYLSLCMVISFSWMLMGCNSCKNLMMPDICRLSFAIHLRENIILNFWSVRSFVFFLSSKYWHFNIIFALSNQNIAKNNINEIIKRKYYTYYYLSFSKFYFLSYFISIHYHFEINQHFSKFLSILKIGDCFFIFS